MRFFNPIRRYLHQRPGGQALGGAQPSAASVSAVLFQAVGTRLADGSVRFRVVSAAPISDWLQGTVRRTEHPSFLQASSGKTLQASFSVEGMLIASGPGTFFHEYRQVPQSCVTCTPENFSKTTTSFDCIISRCIKVVKSAPTFFPAGERTLQGVVPVVAAEKKPA